MQPRSAGILLHPTSLPSLYGIGDLGPSALQFLDWLQEAGQTLWQLLPLGPPAQHQSPYGVYSSFAGNPLLISPERLVQDGLLEQGELAGLAGGPPGRWVPEHIERTKIQLLRTSWKRFQERGSRDALERFCSAPEQAGWLEDYVLFATLHEQNEGEAWWCWPRGLADREPGALEEARERWAQELDFHRFLQFLFYEQWSQLRVHAHDRGITLMGDLPIYPAHDSADVWAHRELFDLDEDGRSRVVAGVPPDYFSEDGQLWGNPIYRWPKSAETGYSWWIDRVAAQLRLFDQLRLDHFRAFATYYEVDAAAETAREGRWVPGPGRELFRALKEALGELPLVAEDLGDITEEVIELRRDLGLPGMRVLQFGLAAVDGHHCPHRFEPNDVVYTGTHDNDTTVGWFAGLSRTERKRVLRYTGGRPRSIHRDAIRTAYTSVAHLAVVPMQDVLGLGREARMNTPGVADGNWLWRLPPEALSPGLARWLRRRVELAGRLPGASGG